VSFPRYPKYKDCGVEWLGEVPEHWEVKCLGHLCSKIGSGKTPSGGAETYLDEGIVFLRSQNVYDEGLFLDDVVYITEETDEDLRASRVLAGDILLNITGASLGRTCLVPNGLPQANVNQHVCIIRLTDLASRAYIAQSMKSSWLRGQIANAQTGAAREGLNFAQIAKLALTIPPLPEQTAIAAFLDCETARIDALVAEQQRLIGLLKEKRQAVISHAVTKGLNPHTPLKPSGIEWLGDVPAHWRVGAIKYFVLPKNGAIKTGPFGSHLTSSDMQSGTIKVYNQRSVIDGDFDSGDNFISEEKFVELATFETFPGDLLITTRGTIGRAAILPQNAERGILHPCLLRLQPDNAHIETEFLKTLIQDSDLMKTQLSYLSNATTIEVIYSYTIASVIIPVPPVAEQHAIMEYLAHQTAKLDTLTTEAQRAIDLLQERRTALISAAVTGQIDVRASSETTTITP